jgi:hypothetical protein
MIAKKLNTVEKLRYQIQSVKHEILQEERSLSARKGRLVLLQKELAKMELMERVK